MMSIYKLTRTFLYPVIFLADFFQTNFTKYFTPMNVGPVRDPNWKKVILKYLKKKDFILDYGCGVGFFSRLFNKKKYIGIEINKNFLAQAKKINKGYIFLSLKRSEIKKFRKKTNAVLINNVLHHMNDREILESLSMIKANSQRKTKILVIEPIYPNNFFSFEFFLKALDIGDYIRKKEGYLKILKKHIDVKDINVRRFGIGTAVIFFGYFTK